MEQKFSNNSIDLQELREFCEREGEAVSYRKGDQMERERLRVGEQCSGMHKHLVISLLNALLPLKDDERVESIEYWPAEKPNL